LLDKYQAGTNEPLREALAKDLNQIVLRGPVYEQKRFANVFLSPDTKDLMDTHPLGVDLIELNRLLLLDAFRGSLARTEGGEITHATADHVIYNYKAVGKTDSGILELNGNPKLQKPHGWVATDKSIIYDRTTGLTHFVGHFESHTDVSAFANGHLPGEPKKSSKQEHK
jgi:hypothetical protein